MTDYLGDFPYGATVYIPFQTFDANGASATITGLLASDIEVYKNGSITQRASDAGYTLLDTDGIDFDGILGIHGFSINTADNTTAGFWGPGNDYMVVISSITVAAQTVNFVNSFSIENRYVNGLQQRTTINTLGSQTSFTLVAGSTDDNAYTGALIVIYDQALTTQRAHGIIAGYTGSTRTVTLLAAPPFTIATGDYVTILADPGLALSGQSVTLSAMLDALTGPLVTVVADGANTASAFEVNVSGVTDNADDWWVDAWLSFDLTASVVKGQTKRITDFNQTTGFMTVSGAYTATPTAGDTARLVTR